MRKQSANSSGLAVAWATTMASFCLKTQCKFTAKKAGCGHDFLGQALCRHGLQVTMEERALWELGLNAGFVLEAPTMLRVEFVQ